jgi:hypothetical protein
MSKSWLDTVSTDVENDINGFFSIFAQSSAANYSPFSGSPNPITEPVPASTVTPAANVGSVILNAFNRIPLWFSSAALPSLAPVVESSQYWPLKLQIANKTFPQAGSTTLDINLIPPANKHWLILSLQISYLPFLIAASNVGYLLTLGPSSILSGNPNSFTPLVARTFFVTASNPSDGFAGINSYAIGGRTQFNLTGIPYYEYGIKPIYVGNGMQALINIENLSAGERIFYSMLYYELPENQPFGNLISIL